MIPNEQYFSFPVFIVMNRMVIKPTWQASWLLPDIYFVLYLAYLSTLTIKNTSKKNLYS